MNDVDVLNAYSRLVRASIDAQLSDTDNSFNNTVGLKLSKNKLLVWLNEPSTLILNIDLKNKLEQIISSVLYPAFVVKHKPGLTLIPRLEQPPESARALAFELHYGVYDRLKVNGLDDVNVYYNGQKLAIALMRDYYWIPSMSPHMAVQSITRGGKTTFLRYLAVNCSSYARLVVKNGAFDDGANPLVVIDPKLDADLRLTALKLNSVYICPDFSKSDSSFIDSVCQQLKGIVDLMQKRAIQKKKQSDIKFKDVFVFLDEGISIPVMGGNTNTKNIYFRLLDRILLMAASFQIHLIMFSQSFLSGSQGALSSQGRLEFGTKILMASRINVENAQFLFKELDKEGINNLILDEDSYGTLGVGIVTNGDGNVVPFKAPFVGDLGQ